jgi:hypothetical protein
MSLPKLRDFSNRVITAIWRDQISGYAAERMNFEPNAGLERPWESL